MSTIAETLTELVCTAVIEVAGADAAEGMESVTVAQDPTHGDYQSNVAFRLSKGMRSSPRAVAEQLMAALPSSALVAAVSVAGPGFLNLRLTEVGLAAEVVARVADPRFGASSSGAGRTLVIDYSSPNIAKRMHVGHLRSTIIGAALDRMHRFLGWNVIADNHVGDWGTPFGMLIVAWDRWRDEAAYAADPVGELQRLYQRFRELEKEEPELLGLARAETAKLQAGDPVNHALWEDFVAKSMAEFQTVYGRLGVSFDVVLGESFYGDKLEALTQDLLARGIAKEDDGAVIVPLDGCGDPHLADKPLLIRKRDGAALYGTTDLATIAHRIHTWNAERMIYVTDVRQKDHFRQVFAAARVIGWDRDFQHIWFGMLKLPGGQVAAARVAGAINLIDVLDEAARRAREIVDARMVELPDEAERAAIAEAVGVGSVIYADLCQNPQSDIAFEWDKMLSLTGNSAPYLMYAHARCCSLLAKVEGEGAAEGVLDAATLADPEARELALRIVRLPEVIAQAAASYRPNLLAEHLYGLAGAFSRFYLACPVLKADVPPHLRTGRLVLVAGTARALATGLGLLGLHAPRRM